MAKFYEMKNAEVWVHVIIGERADEFGRIHKIAKWQRLDAPVSLGSVKKPLNTEIIGFKVVDTSPIDIRSFFGGLIK